MGEISQASKYVQNITLVYTVLKTAWKKMAILAILSLITELFLM